MTWRHDDMAISVVSLSFSSSLFLQQLKKRHHYRKEAEGTIKDIKKRRGKNREKREEKKRYIVK